MHARMVLAAACVSATLVSATSFAQPAPPAPPSSGFPATNVNLTAQDFVTRAAVSDRFEIRAAQIAQRRAGNPKVAGFAARMIADHSKSSAELSAIAARRGKLIVPGELDVRHRGLMEQLKAASARQFAELYMQQQVQAHEDAVALLSSYANNGDDPGLRHFAATTLPLIREHLAMAHALSFEVQHAR